MRSWIIGGAAECDVVVDSPIVSARHCRLSLSPDGYVLEDLGSTNGTFVNSQPITASAPVTRRDVITLGRTLPMPWPSDAPSTAKVVLRIGREPDNDFVVDLPTVSGHHARVIWEGESGRASIEDLGSSNGTALGSPEQKITQSALSAADTIYLGSYALPAAQVLARLQPLLAPSLPFHGAPLVIGRDPACDLVVDLPVVSGRHARLVRRDERILVEDLGSSNGTFVNGERIDSQTLVKDGDLIGLGSHSLILRDESRQGVAREVLAAAGEAGVAVAEPPEVPWWAHLRDEAARSLAQPWRLAALLVQAPLLAIAIAIAVGTNVPEPPSPENLKVASQIVGGLLLWLSLAAIWFGLSTALLGNLLDAPRIRSGLEPEGAGALVSRLGVLECLCVIQSILAWAVVATLAGLKAPALPAVALLVLASAVGLVLGLVIVVSAPRVDVAWAAAALAMLLFWVFGGEQKPLPEMSSWARTVSSALPSRWAFEGLLLLESDRQPPVIVPSGPEPAMLLDLAEGYFPAETERMGTKADAIALGSMLIGLTAAAAFISTSSKNRS